MAISLETINVGVENQATGSDSLFTAFTKTNNNFSKIASTASQYTNFVGSNGISTSSNPTSGTVSIYNTGVLSITAGTGITASNSNGNITLSVSGYANGTLVAGVTNVGISSNTLDVTNSPIISNGVMSVDLATVGTITPGTYTAPNVTVDEFGRVTAISNTVSTGTVTSVSFVAGDGIALSGTNPIVSSGTITIENDGVTRLNAGPGIELSGRTGEITVSTSNPNPGTVTRVEVVSNTLTVTNGLITSTGVISIELDPSETFSGNLVANYITANSNLTVSGNAIIAGNILANVIAPISGNLLVTGNANVSGNLIIGGNVSTTSGTLSLTGNANVSSNFNVSGNATVAGNQTISGNASVTGNISGNNATISRSLTIGNSIQGNLTTYDANVGNLITVTGGMALKSGDNKPVYVQANTTITGSYLLFTLPSTQGTAAQFLTSDGAGLMNWSTVASSSAPTTSGDSGTPGQIAYDSSYLYVCIGTNTWKRINWSSWP